MRTQLVSSAGALGLTLIVAGGLPLGCDNIDAGTTGEDSAGPKLTRIVVQDYHPFLGRNDITDVLNKHDPVKCSATKVCVAGQFGYPSGECEIPKDATEGTCPDPLLSRPVQLGLPAAGGSYIDPKDMKRKPIFYGGIQIRIVFHKALDPKLEEVTVDPMTGLYSYKLKEGLVKLMGPDGKEVPVVPVSGRSTGAGAFGVPPGYFYDPTGSAETSDPIFLPFGPALVIRPATTLDAGAKYKIVLDVDNIVDRKGKKATDAKGGPLPKEIEFETEPMKVICESDCHSGNCVNIYDEATNNYPDVCSEAKMAPNEIIYLQTVTDIDDTTLDKITLTGPGGKAVEIAVFNDINGDPDACEDNYNSRALVVMPWDSKKAERTKLAPGEYTLKFSGVKAADHSGNAGPDAEFHITVGDKDADPKESPWASDHFVHPDECTMPEMPDMAKPVDMAKATDGGAMPDQAKPADAGSMPDQAKPADGGAMDAAKPQG